MHTVVIVIANGTAALRDEDIGRKGFEELELAFVLVATEEVSHLI